jgi:hypothetical protein
VYFSGGTGYNDQTYFTSTGGGSSCNVTGIMTASNGVPSGAEWLAGITQSSSYTGVGWGCSSSPTITLKDPTGSGVALVNYLTGVCGTYTIVGSASGSVDSKTCSNHYFLPDSVLADASSGQTSEVMTWFLNSLIDPAP